MNILGLVIWDVPARSMMFSALGGIVCGWVVAWSIGRYRFHLRQERRLNFARAMLERHQDALATLDNEAVPTEILDLAIRFAKLIQDPRAPSAVMHILAKDPQAFRATPNGEDTEFETWRAVVDNTRPDLVETFMTANIAGMRAFIARWPKCGPVFEDVLVDLGAAPIREAERVIRVTNKAMSYREAPKMALAH